SKEIRSGFIRFVVDWMMEKPASSKHRQHRTDDGVGRAVNWFSKKI
uniref:Uncharacterized protein n=1 Tax=Triticum urartu TaxID=4572 RepID=A0A8R7P3B1_TRIUA